MLERETPATDETDAHDAREALGDRVLRELQLEVARRFELPVRTGHDEDLERLFRASVADEFPDDVVLGEELPDTKPWGGDGWIVDPLDGTNNFVGGLPLFCVSFAYLQSGKPVLGWVGDPLRGTIWKAKLGSGSWRDGKRLEAGGSRPGKPLVALSSHWRRREPERASALAGRVKDRTLGVLAMELCWVADGRLAAGIWTSSCVWDIAAGILIASEAGVVVESEAGAAISFEATDAEAQKRLRDRRFSLIAWPPDVREKLVEIVGGVPRSR